MGLGLTDFKVVYSAVTYTPNGSVVPKNEKQMKHADFIQTSAVNGKRTFYEVGYYYEVDIAIYNSSDMNAEIEKWKALHGLEVTFYPRQDGSWNFTAILYMFEPKTLKDVYNNEYLQFKIISTDYVTHPDLTP